MTEDPELVQLRMLAAHLSEQAAEGRRQLQEEHSASFRWLMASLLALNGAGLLGLKDIRLSDPTLTLIAGCSFFVGICCALLIASLGQKSNQRMMDPISRAAMYWRGVATTGDTNEEAQNDIDGRIAEAMKGAKRPAKAGYASLFFFAIGLLAIAFVWVPA